MEKNQRDKAKKQLKKLIEELVEFPMSLSASYKDKTRTWKIYMSVEFPIPAGMEVVEKGAFEDEKREAVIEYMGLKRQEIEDLLTEACGAIPSHGNREDFNYTQTFPPIVKTVSMMAYPDGVRLKTPEELEKARQAHPNLVDSIEHDIEVLSKGYFVYEGTEEYEQSDGFRLLKYSGLRARFEFTIPHKKTKMATR